MSKGHAYLRAQAHDSDPARPLADWEALVVDAVGNTMDFWRFKLNHGRVWALLYLRGEPLTAQQLEAVLQLSKGAVNLVTRELERWKVIRRVRLPGEAIWRFLPETNFWTMVRGVLEERETSFVTRVRDDLEKAYEKAKADATDKAVLDRLSRLLRLATLVDKAMRTFVKSARLDIAAAIGVALDIQAQ